MSRLRIVRRAARNEGRGPATQVTADLHVPAAADLRDTLGGAAMGGGVSGVRVLVVDVGGTRVKFRLSGEDEIRRFRSGPQLTPEVLVEEVRRSVTNSDYDVVSIGYPGAVADGALIAEPGNLGDGWVGFDFARAFGAPARVVNDAILQALGAYRGGRMLFLGLGTGVGSALVSEHVMIALELGCLPHADGGTLFDHLGRAARKARGHEAWRANVVKVTPLLRAALGADYVVLGGGNGRKVDPLPPNTYRGGMHDAFEGGARLWQEFVEPPDGQAPPLWRVLR